MHFFFMRIILVLRLGCFVLFGGERKQNQNKLSICKNVLLLFHIVGIDFCIQSSKS